MEDSVDVTSRWFVQRGAVFFFFFFVEEATPT